MTQAIPGAYDIEELPNSTPLLADPAQLRERWQQDGVLFFRDVIDRDAVARVREQYLARLKDLKVVDQSENEPRWNGQDRVDGTQARPVGDDIWQGLVADASCDAVVSTFLGGKPAWVPIVVRRTAPPAPTAAAQPFAARHQDGIYNYGIDFITCWVPLMDIDDEVGGLAVVPGSHKSSLYPPDVFANPEKRVGIPADAIPDKAWRRPDYKAGDLLMFHSMTAHAGLPNRSDRFRLSMDVRFLPLTQARPLIGKVSVIEDAALEIADEGGASNRVVITDPTIVRGPKGHPVTGNDREGIIFPGADIIVVPDDQGQAKLLRSVSRKYIDLPAAWFDTLPADWVK